MQRSINCGKYCQKSWLFTWNPKFQNLKNANIGFNLCNPHARFICVTHQEKQNGSILLTNEWCTAQLEQTQILPIQKCMGHTAIVAKNHLDFWTRWWRNSLHVSFVWKHNGTLLLTYERMYLAARAKTNWTKQLQKPLAPRGLT